MDFPLDFQRWPRRDDCVWLIPGRPPQGREDLHSFDAATLRFSDLLASVDSVITKPGYGTFVEAACVGTAILYLKRDDWPETPHFAQWLGRHARATALGREAVLAGNFMRELEELRVQPAPPLPLAEGAGQAARKLVEVFAEGYGKN
jgi:UDP-N-acetylglucosamine:LPS N-acetylglucosamine transferase